MYNRYGEEYSFEPIRENVFRFVGNTKFCRFGGKENATGMENNDLGFFDPSGGPFISEGYKIGQFSVKRIFIEGSDVCFEVE